MDEGGTQETETQGGKSRLGGLVLRGAPLLAASVIGAGIAIGVVAGAGLGGGSTTVEAAAATTTSEPATAPASGEPPALASDDGGLTVAEIYERSAPGVVRVTSVANVSDVFGDQGNQALGTGSGFVIDTAGHIITNYHVVQGAEEVDVTFSDDEEPVRAKVVGVDPSTDIAVLHVELPEAALSPLPLGRSSDVQVGDEVVAIGNPFGLDRTVTKGIVSALQRRIQAPNGYPIEDAIQTDAAINPGNSGGPLLNASGDVIGVNSQIETGGGIAQGNVGVGFAVPIDTVRDVAAQLIESGKVERAYLGVEPQTITADLAENFHLPVAKGVLIARVGNGTPADVAGLQGGQDQVILNGETYVIGGDIVVAVDGKPVTTAEELREAILSHKPGDTVNLEVNRDGKTLTITVELGSQPETPTS
jgi:S1-C subfamily serine protease